MTKSKEATTARRRSTTQRGNGQGSVQELRRGVWRVRVLTGYTVTEDGKRIPRQRSQVVHGSKADALAVLDELRTGKKEGTLATSSDTVAAFLARWIQTSSPRWAISTTRRNAGIVNLYLGPVDRLGSIKLRDLNAGHLASLYGSLTRSGAEPGTVWRVHAVISRALSDAVAWKEIPANTNPAPEAKSFRPRVTKQDPRPATGDEANAIEAEAGLVGPMWADLLEIAASQGLRRGEVCALRWHHVDRKTKTIMVAWSTAVTKKKETGATWAIVPTKGRKVRELPLTASAADALDRQWERASSQAPAAYVFSEDPTGLVPVHPDRVTRVASAARKAAGLSSDLKPVHGLRGYAATVIAGGASPREAQWWMGHDSLTTTERYIGRVSAESAAAVKAIDKARKPRKALSA